MANTPYKLIKCKIFLLNSEILDKANYTTTSWLFDKSLLINGAVPYMVKICESLKIFYLEVEHITCVAYTLHQIGEEIKLVSKSW